MRLGRGHYTVPPGDSARTRRELDAAEGGGKELQGPHLIADQEPRWARALVWGPEPGQVFQRALELVLLREHAIRRPDPHLAEGSDAETALGPREKTFRQCQEGVPLERGLIEIGPTDDPGLPLLLTRRFEKVA